MKTRQKILLTALSAALIATLTSGLTLTALADQATEGHEFDGKLDVVFEDFDRDIISDTVKAEGDHVDLGEKPYLHVEYTAGQSATTAGPIYKHGSGTFAELNTSGTITFRMRAPKGDVQLSELMFGVRGVDSEAAVLVKPMSELLTSENEGLPELTTEWKDFEIDFATSYEPDDKYPTTEDTFGAKPVLAIHLFAAEDAEGTLDIDSVKYNQTVVDNFLGGDTVDATAKVADSAAWWAGSAQGYIVKRVVKLTAGGSFSVVKTAAVGNYDYAIIETEGDTAHLKVATTTDGTTWGTPEAYDGYSVALNGTEKGFKFSYDGSAQDGVSVKRIYLTNAVQRAPETVVPVIDASSAQVLEDFSVAQSGISGVWEDMSTAPQLEEAGLDYRLSYSNNNAVEPKVEVKDGCLVFDATDLTADGHGDYINFKFKSKSVVNGKYVVFKVKAEGGASLDTFRFKLGDPEDAYTDEVWSHDLKVAYGLATPLLDESNPYRDGDWYYIVVDIEESGFAVSEAGYCGLDLYLGGTGKLYIDTIFFADKLPNVEQDLTAEGIDFAGTTLDWEYAGNFPLNNKYGTATAFSFDITPKDDNFSIGNLRFVLGSGTYWASENPEGTLITTERKKLNELTYAKGVATHIEIDIAASGIGAFDYVHVHTTNMGGFKLDNVKLHTSTRQEDFRELSENVITLKGSFTAAPTADQTVYAYIGGETIPTDRYGKLEFTLTPGADFDPTGFRVSIAKGEPSVKDFWIAQQGDAIITADGKSFDDIEFTEGTPVNFVFDLIAMDADKLVDGFHVHSNGISTGHFTVSDVKLTAMADNYAGEVGKLPTYLDTVKPEVHITTPTTATAGDEITVAYTATDDVASADQLEVTVSVTKDGEAVTLTEGKFTAAEGVYTVTVTARDVKGNEASDTIQITVSAQQGGGTQGGGTQGGGTQGGGTTPGTTEGGNGGLSTGAIVGIVIGVLAGVVLIAVIIVVVRKKRH